MAQVLYKIINAKDFLKARPTGELDLEQSKKILGDIADMAGSAGEYDILIDVRESFSSMTHSDIWELVQELGRHRKAFRNKIAVLARDDAQFSKAVFGEMCANMAMHTFKLAAFNDYEAAIEWLQETTGIEDLWK
jgi:hypothetical protein